MQYLLVGLATCAITGIASTSTSLHSGILDKKLNEDASQSSMHPDSGYNKKLITRPSLEFDSNSELEDPNDEVHLKRIYMGNNYELHAYDNKKGIKLQDGVGTRKRRDTWVETMHKDIRNRSEEAYKAGMGAFERMREIARSKRDVNTSDKSDVTEATQSEIVSEENKTNQTNNRGNGSDATIALVYGIRNKTNNSTTAKTGQEIPRQMGPKDFAFNDRGDVLKVEGGVIKIAGQELELGKTDGSVRNSNTQEGENNDGSIGNSSDPKRNQLKDRGSLQKDTGDTMERNNRNRDPSLEDSIGSTDREGNRSGMGPRDQEENSRDEGERRRRNSQTNQGNVEDARR